MTTFQKPTYHCVLRQLFFCIIEYIRSCKHFYSSCFLLYLFFTYYYTLHGVKKIVPIKSIIVEKVDNNKCNIRIELEINNSIFFLVYKNVVSYLFNVPKDHKWFAGKMCWGYGEFELLSNGYINHKILCLDNCEFDITCKKVYIKKK